MRMADFVILCSDLSLAGRDARLLVILSSLSCRTDCDLQRSRKDHVYKDTKIRISA